MRAEISLVCFAQTLIPPKSRQIMRKSKQIYVTNSLLVKLHTSTVSEMVPDIIVFVCSLEFSSKPGNNSLVSM